MSNYPHTRIILAMSADGKISTHAKTPARFSSPVDLAHLETQLSQVDAALIGANTLRAYGTTLPITNPQLLVDRQQANKPPQPVHIICSHSGQLNPEYPFFRQPVPRWLLTTPTGANLWHTSEKFDKILTYTNTDINWQDILGQLWQLGIEKLAILGGGELVASLLTQNLIDDIYLTICPVLLGGKDAPTPVGGNGLLPYSLTLVNVEQVGQELFLHYKVLR